MNLNAFLQIYEEWGKQLYPAAEFDDIVDKVEKLGNNLLVRVCIILYVFESNNFFQQTRNDIVRIALTLILLESYAEHS